MPDSTPKVISLDQKRAAYAWKCVQHHGDNDYAKLAKGAPALIMNNGLMQTLAFYWDKGFDDRGVKQDKKYYALLAADILNWLKKNRYISAGKFHEIMTQLASMNTNDYRMASMESLEVLKWIRQLAAAVNKGEEGNA